MIFIDALLVLSSVLDLTTWSQTHFVLESPMHCPVTVVVRPFSHVSHVCRTRSLTTCAVARDPDNLSHSCALVYEAVIALRLFSPLCLAFNLGSNAVSALATSSFASVKINSTWHGLLMYGLIRP